MAETASEVAPVASNPAVVEAPVATIAAEKIVAATPAASAPVEAPAKTTTQKSESEILVKLEPSKKSGEGDSPWIRLFAGLAIVGVLAAGSMIYIKKIKKGKFNSEPAPDIKVLTQHYLGPKKSLAIIRVAGESILIGITDQNISLIKELSLLDEDIPESIPSKFSLKIDKENNNELENDEFSISGIKDVVTTRLKNMRTLQ